MRRDDTTGSAGRCMSSSAALRVHGDPDAVPFGEDTVLYCTYTFGKWRCTATYRDMVREPDPVLITSRNCPAFRRVTRYYQRTLTEPKYVCHTKYRDKQL